MYCIEKCEPVPYQGSSVCGDGIVGEEELCDDANSVDDDGCSNTCESTRGELVANSR
jgi:cysteine-rich repeat protein